jgi:hypothetical protein
LYIREPHQVYILSELLRRDPNSEKLANLLLQHYGYDPRGQGKSDAEIAAQMRALCEALSQAYGVDLDHTRLLNAEELENIKQGLLSDVESGELWLPPDKVALLAFLDQAHPAFLAQLRHALSTQPIPDTLDIPTLDTLVDNIITTLGGIASREEQGNPRDRLKWVVQALCHEAWAQQSTQWSEAAQEAWMTQALKQRVIDQISDCARGHWVQDLSRNWEAPGTMLLRQNAWSLFLDSSLGSPPPPGAPPTLTITIDLSKVPLVGISELADEFTFHVKQALDDLPHEWRIYPTELEFLRTISKEDLTRALRRYDLHMKHGYTFRQIAWLETDLGRSTVPSSPPTNIGRTILGEDGVEKSVKKIYAAIYRQPYRARRRRLDTPAWGLKEYFCSIHPTGDCPADCPNLLAFANAFNATSPTDSTGQGKETVPFDKFIQVKEVQEGQQSKRPGCIEDD